MTDVQASTTSPDALLTTKDVAAIIQVHPRTVHRLVRYGQLPRPVINHGKVHRWRPQDIQKHFERKARMRA